MRLLLPPHTDNESAAEVLRTEVGKGNPHVEWVAVRPSSLTNAPQVTEYELYASPTGSPFFDPGHTGRANVAHFMAELLTSPELWSTWQSQMPVIYDK